MVDLYFSQHPKCLISSTKSKEQNMDLEWSNDYIYLLGWKKKHVPLNYDSSFFILWQIKWLIYLVDN